MRNYLIFLFLYPFLSLSQIEISGKVVDSYGQPIPYANLHNLKKSIGTVCDENGHFNFSVSKKHLNDSITVSSLGYNVRTILIKDLNTDKKIELISKVTELKTFEVKNYDYLNQEIGNLKNPNFGWYSMTPGGEWACWIPNKKNRVGYIKSISAYIKNMGAPNEPFRLKLYSKNQITDAPDKNLLEKSIIVKGVKGDEWVTANIDSLRIMIPTDGFFIGVEWLKSSISKVFHDTITDNYVATYYGQVVGGVSERKNKGSRTWYKSYLEDWQYSYNYTQSNVSNVLNLAVKAEISYRKGVFDKNKNTRIKYKKLKERKYKRYFSIPNKDLKEFPQYSIEKLYQSIYNCFENNSFSYVLYHLCSFDKEGRKEAFEELKLRSENNEPLFTQKEKENILKDFKYYIENLSKAKITSIDTDKFKIVFPNGVTTFLQVKDKNWYIMPLFYKQVKV